MPAIKLQWTLMAKPVFFSDIHIFKKFLCLKFLLWKSSCFNKPCWKLIEYFTRVTFWPKLTLSLRFCSAHLMQSIPIEIPELRGDWAVYFDFKLLANYRFVWIQINYTFWKHMTLYSVFGWKESKSESKGELCIAH